MSNWKFTTIHHPARIEMGLSVLQYCIFDIYYRSQTNPDYNVKGWAKNSYGEISRFLGVSKGTVFSVVEKGVKAGYIEVNPANTTLKRTTKKWYKKAYEEDNVRSKTERKTPNRSKTERSENERDEAKIVQKMNGSVQKMNVINKDKLNTNTIKDKCVSTHAQKEEKVIESLPTEKVEDFSPQVAPVPPQPVQSELSWMQVSKDMANWLNGDGADQWQFMCDSAGGYVEPSVITSAWAGKYSDSQYMLRRWKKEACKLQGWIKNELRSQKRNSKNKGSGIDRLSVNTYGRKGKEIQISKVPV